MKEEKITIIKAESVEGKTTSIQTLIAAGTKALNSEAGQRLTEKLIQKVLQEKPDITMDEWKKIQTNFGTYMIIKMSQELSKGSSEEQA